MQISTKELNQIWEARVNGRAPRYLRSISKQVYTDLKLQTTSGVEAEAFDGVDVFEGVEGFGFLNATSPNKLTAALTDAKGARVSISPMSVLGESKEFERLFTPMLLVFTKI